MIKTIVVCRCARRPRRAPVLFWLGSLGRHVRLLWLPLLFVFLAGAAGQCSVSAQSTSRGFSDLDVPDVPLRVAEKAGSEEGVAAGGAATTTTTTTTTARVRGRDARGLRVAAREGGVGLVRPTALISEARPAVLRMSAVGSLAGLSTGDVRIDQIIVESGVRNGVDPILIFAVMSKESSFKRMAVSPKGARGLMQLMPGTARRFEVSNIFDPRENIEGGTRYLRWLLDYFDGDLALALAGYNAGEGNVLKYGRQIPPFAETREYVRRIGERYIQFRRAAGFGSTTAALGSGSSLM